MVELCRQISEGREEEKVWAANESAVGNFRNTCCGASPTLLSVCTSDILFMTASARYLPEVGRAIRMPAGLSAVSMTKASCSNNASSFVSKRRIPV